MCLQAALPARPPQRAEAPPVSGLTPASQVVEGVPTANPGGHAGGAVSARSRAVGHGEEIPTAPGDSGEPGAGLRALGRLPKQGRPGPSLSVP